MKFSLNNQAFETELSYGNLTISGEEEHGFRPFALLVSSVAGCSGGVLRKVMDKQRIDFKDIQIEAEVERNEAEANRIEKITMHFTVYAENLSQKKAEKALAISSKNCSMVQSVKGSIEIVETIEVIPAKG
ncbi:OsmC family protein [Oceanobacillus kimchii]|uniref:OsmC family protein n=1 Tax=Oceanobacillus kimchii TaxID=746691 RepID=UPI00034D13E0|nr:OsmC family protein [Oceanobacillus kimchii]MCT1576804.1 OsmC family protein [Oceanobacillus kimchii]MCT2134874.1 OsmC family protein [Oceanobacillus kimchii]